MSLVLSDITGWLATQFAPTTVLGNRMQDTPDQVIMVGIRRGAGPTFEGVFEEWDVEVNCRGPVNDDVAAETLAGTVHAWFLAHQSSFALNGKWVLKIISNGPPSYMGIDEPRRTTYVTSYRVTAQI